ncbi:tunicamycin resistance protein [Puccinia graminis f. sp. tritici]|uniref:UDP-N-acetylglucosamine--dolichyl-phosphate N-acetylglucosaminephosphotransferase n=1 Tax=Puccinia graminis f. sp. tritici TaxID=56615 RepID=A0A5B0PKU2_PUCGR|nr:tunicamycin resistance protein [Puccinia graminis f. sp. tritici]
MTSSIFVGDLNSLFPVRPSSFFWGLLCCADHSFLAISLRFFSSYRFRPSLDSLCRLVREHGYHHPSYLRPSSVVWRRNDQRIIEHSINILAGINGVEVGQSLIICLSIICNDLLYIHLDLAELGLPHRFSFGFANGSKALEDRHLFSLCLMLPLFAVMLALIKFNWYPARAFVGDTFCYFAGMAFAVVGILGHFSKTLLLFFIPQILNFLYSSPQLFGILPISRHRLPSRDPIKNILKPSIVLFKTPLPASPTLKSSLLKAFETLRLIQLVRNKHNLVVGCSNLTLLNLALIWLPGLNERQLSSTILAFQFFSNFFIGFFIRYFLADLFYDPRLR